MDGACDGPWRDVRAAAVRAADAGPVGALVAGVPRAGSAAHRRPRSATLDALGLLDLYDEVRPSLQAVDPVAVDPVIYYTGGKIVALAAEDAPVAMVDLDLFLREPLPLGTADFLFAHWETTDSDTYPAADRLPGAQRFIDGAPPLPERACNTAVAVFGDERHLRAFTDAALSFMDGNADPGDLPPVALPAFCEQRLVLREAARLGIRVAPVMPGMWNSRDSVWIGPSPEKYFHHTWHHKRSLANYHRHRDAYCLRLLVELALRYPGEIPRLRRIPSLAPYFAAARVLAEVDPR